MRSFRHSYLFVAICLASVVLSSCSKPILLPNSELIVVDSQVFPPVFLESKTLSDEPTIFVRAINKTGHPEINFGDQTRAALEESGKRITMRSEGASYTVLIHFLYLDENNKKINIQKTLSQGFATPLATSGTSTNNAYLGVSDLEIIENSTGEKYQTRICVELTPSKIMESTAREKIIDRTIAEVNNIFSY